MMIYVLQVILFFANKRYIEDDINVHVLPDDNISDLNLEGYIDINTNNYVRSTNKLYLEFLRTDSGYAECNCSVIFTDTYKYSISPPM